MPFFTTRGCRVFRVPGSRSRVPGLPGSGGAAGRLETRKREYDPGDASDLSHAQALCMACAARPQPSRRAFSNDAQDATSLVGVMQRCFGVLAASPPSSVRGFTCEPGQRIQLERHAAIGNLCTGGMSWKAYCAARRFACDGAED